MATKNWGMIIGFVLSALGMASCVLFEDVEFNDVNSTAETNDTALDYWDDGRCPGNTMTDETKVSEHCHGITATGCCDMNGNALYCHGESLYCKSCSSNQGNAAEVSCSWSDAEAAYWCTAADNGPEPSGTYLKACPVF